MLSKFAATVLLSIVVLIVVTLFVSLGVLWWTGDGTRSVLIGVICGAVAVLTVRAVAGTDGRGTLRRRRLAISALTRLLIKVSHRYSSDAR